ncbi:PIG-L family deacetylase [Gordonia sp. CPCC 206044]|uniref:PIG-L deacetylase family protein n=1 Tax=Gordonia sp. CPCC 206044 TaxID=3140793 RepID=UPI003AF37ED3
MSVLVCFHAHPDDEVFSTGGTMRSAADAGHRVVLVTATDGALGEYPDGLLAAGESLTSRRRDELETSAELLGAHRLVMLGYPDSGMAGTPENQNPSAFANVSVDHVAQRLAEILVDEGADVMTIYDSNGGYGHPDHIQVHHVGRRAAEIAGTAHVFESVVNRDHMRKLIEARPDWDGEDSSVDIDSFGVPADQITVALDVGDQIEVKRAAMVAHASQIGDFGPFLEMPTDELRMAFGVEWYSRVGSAPTELMETGLPL